MVMYINMDIVKTILNYINYNSVIVGLLIIIIVSHLFKSKNTETVTNIKLSDNESETEETDSQSDVFED